MSNATYLSPRIQNEMIEIVGREIQLEISRRVKKSGVFDMLMDATTDVSHKEQVAIFVRYVSTTENIAIEERMLALVDTDVTTGEGLAKSPVNALTFHGLDLCNIVGQGYDGGSNMRGAQIGVQARIKEINPVAIFMHCFAHNLDRALVNASCDMDNPDARNFLVLWSSFLRLSREVQRVMHTSSTNRRSFILIKYRYT